MFNGVKISIIREMEHWILVSAREIKAWISTVLNLLVLVPERVINSDAITTIKGRACWVLYGIAIYGREEEEAKGDQKRITHLLARKILWVDPAKYMSIFRLLFKKKKN